MRDTQTHVCAHRKGGSKDVGHAVLGGGLHEVQDGVEGLASGAQEPEGADVQPVNGVHVQLVKPHADHLKLHKMMRIRIAHRDVLRCLGMS